jgi:hypothetical protein
LIRASFVSFCVIRSFLIENKSKMAVRVAIPVLSVEEEEAEDRLRALNEIKQMLVQHQQQPHPSLPTSPTLLARQPTHNTVTSHLPRVVEEADEGDDEPEVTVTLTTSPSASTTPSRVSSPQPQPHAKQEQDGMESFSLPAPQQQPCAEPNAQAISLLASRTPIPLQKSFSFPCQPSTTFATLSQPSTSFSSSSTSTSGLSLTTPPSPLLSARPLPAAATRDCITWPPTPMLRATPAPTCVMPSFSALPSTTPLCLPPWQSASSLQQKQQQQVKPVSSLIARVDEDPFGLSLGRSMCAAPPSMISSIDADPFGLASMLQGLHVSPSSSAPSPSCRPSAPSSSAFLIPSAKRPLTQKAKRYDTCPYTSSCATSLFGARHASRVHAQRASLLRRVSSSLLQAAQTNNNDNNMHM